MKNKFFIQALTGILLCSVANIGAMGEDNGRPKNAVTLSKDERDTQKMIFMLVGSGALLAGSHVLADRMGFPDVGNFFNLSRGEFQAACGLSSLFAGIGLIANEQWKPTIRSAAWRFPLMAMLGGLLNHPQVHRGLQYAPLGLGGWFKDNSPVGKPGIAAIYNIGAWYALKPTLDRAENKVSAVFAKK